MSNTQEKVITIKRMINGQRYAAMPLAVGGAIKMQLKIVSSGSQVDKIVILF